MKESILLFILRVFSFFVRQLPFKAALGVGRCFGMFAYFISKKYREQVYSNLKQAFASEKRPSEIRVITKKFFCSFGENIVDFMRMPLSTKENFENLIAVEGIPDVKKALEGGKGAILLAMHFGSWEMASFACSVKGLPYRVFVKEQGGNILEKWLNQYRSCFGAAVITRGLGTKDLVKSLRDNKAVGMVFDQGGKKGVLVPFFGRTASMSAGAVRMGVKSAVPVCFSVISRQADRRHRLVMHAPLKIEQTDDQQCDIQTQVAKITSLLEGYIRKYPDQYLWTYKIWKYSDQAKVIVLTDGKAGHENQSKAAAHILIEALKDRGIVGELEIVRVEFKDRQAFLFANFLNFFCPWFFRQGFIERLQGFLTEESFHKVISLKGDYVISAGSKIALINDILKREMLAKNVHILGTGGVSIKKFNRVLMLAHDVHKPHRDDNIVITKAALNLVTEKYLNEKKTSLLTHFNHLQTKHNSFIGVFIGGESKNVRVTEAQIKVLIHQLEDLCREVKATMLVTTSRRTSNSIERFLFKRLKKNPLCSLLVLAGQDNVPEAMGGILGLCDVAVVSGDSISMVSEAISSGKPTVVLYPAGSSRSKHHRFIDTLFEGGYALSSDVQGVGHIIYDVFKNKRSTKPLNDESQVLTSFRTLI